MVTTTLAPEALLSEAELVRIARILARFLAGRQLSPASAASTGRAAGSGLDFLDFREYQRGDDFRSIDWRASARSSATQVRRYYAEVASDWYLCVDASASMGAHGGANWVLARKLAAALAYVFLYCGHRVGLLMFSSEVDAACALGRGHSHYARILKTLSSHSLRRHGGGSDPGACASVVGHHHPLLIVSDFLTEDAMVAALVKLQARRRQLHLFHLNCVEHWQLPTASSLLLEDIESGRRATCSDPDTAHNEASSRLVLLYQDLSNWCHRYQIPLTQCSSNGNWRDLLLRHFLPG